MGHARAQERRKPRGFLPMGPQRWVQCEEEHKPGSLGNRNRDGDEHALIAFVVGDMDTRTAYTYAYMNIASVTRSSGLLQKPLPLGPSSPLRGVACYATGAFVKDII